MIKKIHYISPITVLQRYFSQNLQLKIKKTLHLSESTIQAITFNSQKVPWVPYEIKNKELKTCFDKAKVLLSTRQHPNLRKLLTTAKL